MLPSLRQRRSDIPILVWHFMERHAHGRRVDISRSALELLRGCDFPRNVRQLENAIVEALARSDPGALILPKHLPQEITAAQGAKTQAGPQVIPIPQDLPYAEAREWVCREFDKVVLGEILSKHSNNQSRAAEEAGIDRKTFSARIASSAEHHGDQADG
jgi:DNA-binding NtrC family response regulator